MTKIVAHHGSPGTPEDFKYIKELLTEGNWQTVDRYHQGQGKAEGPTVFLGYSWGSVNAVLEAAENSDTTMAVVLVAPYMFTEKKMALPVKLLLSAPVVGGMLLSKIAPGAISKMLNDSASPKSVPDNYKPMQDVFSRPDVLKPALFEKEMDQGKLKSALEKLKAKNVPIFVIRGKDDKTSGDEQVNSLKNLVPVQETVLPDAGHALPWTHPREVADTIRGYFRAAAYASVEKTDDVTLKPGEKFGYFEGKHKLNNVSAFLSDHVQKIPDRKILSWVHPDKLKQWSFDLNDPLPHDSVTVRELDILVGRIANAFKKLGIKSGDRVIVFIPMSLYLYAAMFALQKIGAIATFLDSWARRDQMGVAADVVDAKAMVSVEMAFQYLGEVPQIAKIPIKVVAGPAQGQYTAKLEELMQNPEYELAEPVEKEHTALITFTTGSSGTPKGADRTHRFLAAQHYALNRHLPYKSDDSDLPVFPIFSLNNLAAGVTTVIPAIDVGTPGENDALVLIAQMKATGTTCTTLSPSLLRSVYKFCQEKNLKLDFLRRIITGGAPISRDDLIASREIAPNAEILVLYGSTEVEPMAHIEAKEMIAQKLSDDPEWVDEGVNVGKFDEGLTVKYLKINKDSITVNSDDDWKKLEVPHGEVGEIIVAGEHVCEGYFNNTEAFARAKIRDHNGTIWHRTGDLGRVDNVGNLWLVGRVHNAINRGGTYQFPVRAEIILKKLPFVEKAAFLGMPDSELGEKTYAVFTSKEPVSDDKLTEWKSEVQRIMDKNEVVVDAIVHTDDIPMDPRHHSKVEYGILREKLQGKV